MPPKHEAWWAAGVPEWQVPRESQNCSEVQPPAQREPEASNAIEGAAIERITGSAMPIPAPVTVARRSTARREIRSAEGFSECARPPANRTPKARRRAARPPDIAASRSLG
jgi:hypothetical protein